MTDEHIKYELTIKEFEAINGVEKLLKRNDKKLVVRIPSGVRSGASVRLRNAQQITNGCIGDILIHINVATIDDLDPTKGTNLCNIFENCLCDIGGRDNEDLQVYVKGRNKTISRTEYFQQIVWAVWVTGMSRKAAQTFMDNNKDVFTSINYANFGSFSNLHLNEFMEKIHGAPVRNKAQQKWKAIHFIANWLSGFNGEEDFRNKVFQGKTKGSELDKTDINKLINLRHPFIGSANSHYLIKNLGGEAIKEDRWIASFLEWGGLSIDELESRLNSLIIPLGFFDNVMWSYCEKKVGKTNLLDSLFSNKFGYLKI